MSIRFVDNRFVDKSVPLKSLYGSAEAFQDDVGFCYIVTDERDTETCTCLCVFGEYAGMLYKINSEIMVTPVELVITREA